MESIFKLGIMVSAVDFLTKPTSAMGRGLDVLKAKAAGIGPALDMFKKYGRVVAIAGVMMTQVLLGTAMATVETQKALGELASVGVTDMAAMESAAMQFSNQWAGTTKAEFIGAAYDIKSGISSLSDAGVAEFTRLAALTGKATKSTTAEMTSLFATGYGIYKEAYGQLSDLQFGEIFSAGIAASVEAFKTTGSGMAQAISALGAAATTAKVPMEEQLAILGMLQATMSGSEAGTKYRAVMQAAAGAGTKLGLSFTDANNQLFSMPQILETLRGKYGETLDAIEKQKIQQAFGTQEAVAVIDLLYGKVGNLTGNIEGLAAAMQNGTATTEQMAAAMNMDIGAGVGLLGQQWHNLVEVAGKQLIPVLVPLFFWIGRLISTVSEFAERHGTLTRVLVVGAAVLATLFLAFSGVGMALGAVGLALPAVTTGFAALGTAMGLLRAGVLAAIKAVWGLTGALAANPIVWVVVVIVALGVVLAWLYRRFQVVRDAVDAFVYALAYVLGTLWKFKAYLGLALLGPLGLVIGAFLLVKRTLSGINLFDSGAKIIGTLVAGVKSMAMAPVTAITGIFQKVRNLLPFSDAKEGPLSSLTLSGSRIMETLGAGVQGAAPGLHKTMRTALAGAALAATLTVAPVPSLAAVPGTQASGGKPAAAQVSRKGRSVVIQNLTVQLPGVTDADSFVRQLQALVEGYDVD
jgi:hypothetical protein